MAIGMFGRRPSAGIAVGRKASVIWR